MKYRLGQSVLWLMLCAWMPALHAAPYAISNRIVLAGDGGWDYLYADAAQRRLYVSHGSVVHVIDLDNDTPIATITGLKGVHGIAIADKLQRGFISDGKDNTVVIFDLQSYAIVQKVHAGIDPDGIVYDAFSNRVFAFNGGSRDVTVINAATGTIEGTIALGGKPEFPVSDGKGNIYANIEDTSEIAQLDARTLRIKNRRSLAPCVEPSGLALDENGNRLFSVCANRTLVVLNAGSGALVAAEDIGAGCDAVKYDPQLKRIFASNGAGTLSVFKQFDPDHYSVEATITTERGARTMALDTQTHKIYLSSAQLGAAPEATADNPHPRPAILPGTFHLLVVSPDNE